MDWLEISKDLLGFAQTLGVPGAQYGQVALSLIEVIKSQSGMSTEDILARAGVTLDANKIMLLQDLERLKDAPQLPPAPPATETTSPTQPAPPAASSEPAAASVRTVEEISQHLARLRKKREVAKSGAEIVEIEEDITKTEARLERARARESKL
jgi:hypothetical protein